MQSKDQLEASAEAALRHAINEAEDIGHHLAYLRQGVPMENIMPKLRAELAELNKHVHELNAYRNALDTGS